MPGQRKSTEERREEIADVALELIAEEGLRKFTVANISERVGLAEGTIFRHFEDVDDIVLEAVDRLQEVLLEAASGIATPEDEPLDRIEQFVGRRVELISERPELLKLLFSDELAKIGPREAAERVQGLKRRSMTFILEQLREADREGQLESDVSPEELLSLVHGTALATVFSGEDVEAVTGEEFEPTDAIEALLRLVRS